MDQHRQCDFVLVKFKWEENHSTGLRSDKVPQAYDYHMTSFNVQAKLRIYYKSEDRCLTAYLMWFHLAHFWGFKLSPAQTPG